MVVTLTNRVKALEGERDTLAKQVTESKQNYLYALAEAENARKIAARDVEQARQYALTRFAKSLLEVLDTLERATDALADEHADPAVANLIQGVKATERNLVKVFTENGVKAFGAVGDAMDPHRYEAVYVHEGAPHNTVSTVMRKGYTLNTRVVRPAQVGVYRQPASQPQQQQADKKPV